MDFSEKIIPISYLKSNASRIVEDAFTNNQTYIITQNGYAKLVIMGIKEYERTLKDISSLSASLNKKTLKTKITSNRKSTAKKSRRKDK